MQTEAIESRGVIGNMRSAALVNLAGSIDFFCFPAFDSPTIFAALLDPANGGVFRIDPEMKTLRTKQLYLPDTNILLTRFLSSDGVAELTDFMPVTAGDRPSPYAHQVIRILRVVRGEIPFRVLCAPRFNYARVGHTVCHEGDSLCFRPECGDCPSMSLHASVPLRIDGVDGRAEFSLASGQSAVFAFGNVPDDEKASVNLLDRESIEHQFAETTKFWRAWISQSKYTGRWREMVNRSALALKLLTSHEHGSVVARRRLDYPNSPAALAIGITVIPGSAIQPFRCTLSCAWGLLMRQENSLNGCVIA